MKYADKIRFVLFVVLVFAFVASGCALPRIAIVSAYGPELELLKNKAKIEKKINLNGVDFFLGNLEDKEVVMFLGGIGMTNATMNMQLAIDHFNIKMIIFSGIAGGINPSLKIGDIAVASRWANHLYGMVHRFNYPKYTHYFNGLEHLGINVQMKNPSKYADIKKYVGLLGAKGAILYFRSDKKLLDAAKRASRTIGGKLKKINQRPPQIKIGGIGVSGDQFVDNAQLRDHLWKHFKADSVDMESASMTMVANVNDIPIITIRGLSDLAGGSAGKNELELYFKIAADNSAIFLLELLRQIHQIE